MAGLWGDRKGAQGAAVSDDSGTPDAGGVRTELIRIKAILVTLAVLLVVLTLVYVIPPASIEHILARSFPACASLCRLSAVRRVRAFGHAAAQSATGTGPRPLMPALSRRGYRDQPADGRVCICR